MHRQVWARVARVDLDLADALRHDKADVFPGAAALRQGAAEAARRSRDQTEQRLVSRGGVRIAFASE